MSSQKATYIGTENIMRGFDRQSEQTPFWSIWQGRNCYHQHYNDDKDKGRADFEAIINDLDEAEYMDTLTVKFHPTLTSGFITERTPVTGTMLCRVYTANGELAGISEVNRAKYDYQHGRNNALLESIKGMIEPLQNEINELKAGQPAGSEAGIMGLLNHPAAQQIIGHLMPVLTPHINSILSKFIPNGHTAVPAINGVSNEPVNGDTGEVHLTDEDEEIFWPAIDKLAKRMDLIPDIVRLANLSDTNPAMFDMLIQQLRSM